MDILSIINQEKLTDAELNGYVEINDYGNIASWFNTARPRPNPMPQQEVQKQKELDPNYEAMVFITPVEEYGLGKVRIQDVMDSFA